MSDLDLGAIERRVQERIDIIAEHGGLVPLVERDRLQLLNEVKCLRKRNTELLSAGPVDRTSWDKVCAELVDVKAERDRLRDERDHYRGWIETMLADEHLWRDGQGEVGFRTNVQLTLQGALGVRTETT